MNTERACESVVPALELDGVWTVEHAERLKAILLESLESSESIVIGSENLEEIDLSCLQLLCAAHRRSLELGKPLQLHKNRSMSFKRVVATAGFARTLGCHKDPHKSCLWVGGWD